MGTTPAYALPYPELTDVANVPADTRELAEAIEGSFGRPYCEVAANATQSMGTSASVPIVFQASSMSDASMFVNGGSLITVPKTGLYLIVVGYSWAANAAGSRIASIVIAGGGTGTRSWNVGGANVAATITGTLTMTRSLPAGATVGLTQFQSSGSALATFTQSYPIMSVTRIGPTL